MYKSIRTSINTYVIIHLVATHFLYILAHLPVFSKLGFYCANVLVASLSGLCPAFHRLQYSKARVGRGLGTGLIQARCHLKFLLLVSTIIRKQPRMEWLCTHWSCGMAGNGPGMDSKQWWTSCDCGQIWRHENKHLKRTPENAGFLASFLHWDAASECGVKGVQYIQEKPQSGWWFWTLYTSTTVICQIAGKNYKD